MVNSHCWEETGPARHTKHFASIHEVGASVNSGRLHPPDPLVLIKPSFTVLPGTAEPVHTHISNKATNSHLRARPHRLGAGFLRSWRASKSYFLLLVGSLP